MKTTILSVFLFVLFSVGVPAQSILQHFDQNHKNSITIVRDAKVDTLLALQKAVNIAENGVVGYRVQLFWGNSQQTSRTKAEEVKARYLALENHKSEIYTIFESPTWKVQVGDFRTYPNALKLKAELEKQFADMAAYIRIVQTKVNP